MKTFFKHILQGHEATELNAISAALDLNWSEVETSLESYPYLIYIDEINGVGIWYNYGCDSYYFTDERGKFIAWGEHNGLEIQLSDDHKHVRMRDKDTLKISNYKEVQWKKYMQEDYPYFDNPFGMGSYCVYEFSKVDESSPEFGHPDEEPFTTHGVYTWSNSCGYEVELSPCGEAARLRIEGKVTRWLEIEYVGDEDSEDGEMMPVIDPNRYNVPLNLVMRVKQTR